MSEKDLFTDTSVVSSLPSTHFQGIPSHTYCATGKGCAYTPSDPRDPCKVCELQRQYGEEGDYNKRKTEGVLAHHSRKKWHSPHLPLWSSSGTITGNISQDLMPLEFATCSRMPGFSKQYFCTPWSERVRTSCGGGWGTTHLPWTFSLHRPTPECLPAYTGFHSILILVVHP